MISENFKLREYQENDAIPAMQKFFNEYKHPEVAVLPTGAGKSIIICEILKFLPKECKILVLQPNKEVLVQNFNKYKKYSSKCSIYSASLNEKRLDRVVFATIGSIYKISERFSDYRIVIIDECHLVNAKKENAMYTDFINKNKPKILGLTATPFRLEASMYKVETKMLHRTRPSIFKNICYVLPVKYLMDKGYLSQLEYKRYTQSKLEDSLSIATSEFSDKSINFYYLKNKEVLSNICDVILEETQTRNHSLIFVKTQEMQSFIYEYLNSKIENSASFVNSKIHSKDRDGRIEDFQKSKFKYLVVIGICTTGFDFPALDCIVDIAPTTSISLYIQRLGRGTRIHPNKNNCLVLDFANNYNRYGGLEDHTIEEDFDFKTKPLSLFTKINNKKIKLTSIYTYEKYNF